MISLQDKAVIDDGTDSLFCIFWEGIFDLESVHLNLGDLIRVKGKLIEKNEIRFLKVYSYNILDYNEESVQILQILDRIKIYDKITVAINNAEDSRLYSNLLDDMKSYCIRQYMDGSIYIEDKNYLKFILKDIYYDKVKYNTNRIFNAAIQSLIKSSFLVSEQEKLKINITELFNIIKGNIRREVGIADDELYTIIRQRIKKFSNFEYKNIINNLLDLSIIYEYNYQYYLT